MNINKKSLLGDLISIVIGTALCATSLDVFIVPNNLSPGGVSGLAVSVAHFIPLPIGTISFIINIPLIIAALRILGFKQLGKTMVATVLLSAFTDLFSLFLPQYTSDSLLAAGMGGVLLGIGIGILFLRGISTGGTDLLSILLVNKMPNLPVGTLLLIADTIVVLIAVFVFRNTEIALYSFIVILVNSKLIDAIMDGANYAKVVYIVTENGDAVNEALRKYTDRGSTLIQASGGYTGNEKQIVMTVTRKNVLSQTLSLIKAIDPGAFTFVVNAAEVHGEGFKRYHADITKDE